MKTVIFAKDVNLSKLVEMLKICPCCKYVSNLYQTITFTSLLRINTYLANICICPHFSRQRKCNANLEFQIYHIFATFADIRQVFLHISCWLYKQLKAARRWLRFVKKLYFPPTGESIQRIKTRRAVSQVFSYLKSCLA